MTDKKKLEHLAYILKDLSSLRNLFAELNFDFADEPVNKESWNDSEKEIVLESKIVAKKNDYRIYYLQTNTDSLKYWKSVATKIIKENHGFCLVCSHNPSGFKWVFSSLSKEFSKSFTETRHVPIEIKPNVGVPNNFVEFLDRIKVGGDATAISIASQVSESFDTFAIEVHNELTYNVFAALKTLSDGIIAEKSNNLSLSNETLENVIRAPIFTLLYRLIFILYAEDRGIFPVENATYHEKFSLKWIKEEWLLKSTNTKLAEYEVQKRLKNLFKLIELGSDKGFDYPKEEFFMRSYYGRLFDREINSKLESWKISNSHLIKMLELLTRTKDRKGNYFFLDYAALETRHLGAVYEHLLEFHLHVKNKKIIPTPDSEERKTSGSYYTPKYIVDYIVQNSIEPSIDKIINENPDKQTQIEKILELKILDPAMGSGHFLVGTVEYIAKRICKIEFGEITEQAYIDRKRDAVRRCIYGVDINPLAVDLASLSLWLETLSSEKPLSFLQSHLKCGNSLIGSDIESIFGEHDIHSKTTQSTLFESQGAKNAFKKNIKNFLMFENMKDDTPSAVKVKLEEYSKMQSKGTIYKDLQFLLNCKTAESFDVKLPILFRDYSTKIGENSLDYYSDENFQKIDILSKQETFFHWELEFPQIFYDENGNKKTNYGFDVVIGNPPYDVLLPAERECEKHKNHQKDNCLVCQNYIQFVKELEYLKSDRFYENALGGRVNLFRFMMVKGLALQKNNGCLGFIVPLVLLTDASTTALRKHILDNFQIIAIECFPQKDDRNNRVFPEAKLSTCIIISKNKKPLNEFKVKIYPGKEFSNKHKEYVLNSEDIKRFDSTSFSIPLVTAEEWKILKKFNPNNTFTTFKEISESFQGEMNMTTQKSHFTSNTADMEMLKGAEIGRYCINKKMSQGKKEWYSRKYFNQNRNSFRRTNHIFQNRIALQQITGIDDSWRIRATIVSSGTVLANTTNYLLAKSDTSLNILCGILNSKLIDWRFRLTSGNNHVNTYEIDSLPFPINIDLDLSKKFKNLIDQMLEVNAKLAQFKFEGKETDEKHDLESKADYLHYEINNLVYHIYRITEEEKKIIESI